MPNTPQEVHTCNTMSQPIQQGAAQGVAFEVNFEESNKNSHCIKPPKRLQAKQRKTNKEDIDAKLQKAAEKRKVGE